VGYTLKFPSKTQILPFAYQLEAAVEYDVFINSTLNDDLFEYTFTSLAITGFT